MRSLACERPISSQVRTEACEQRILENVEIIVFFGALTIYAIAYVLWLKYAGR